MPLSPVESAFARDYARGKQQRATAYDLADGAPVRNPASQLRGRATQYRRDYDYSFRAMLNRIEADGWKVVKRLGPHGGETAATWQLAYRIQPEATGAAVTMTLPGYLPGQFVGAELIEVGPDGSHVRVFVLAPDDRASGNATLWPEYRERAWQEQTRAALRDYAQTLDPAEYWIQFDPGRDAAESEPLT